MDFNFYYMNAKLGLTARTQYEFRHIYVDLR